MVNGYGEVSENGQLSEKKSPRVINVRGFFQSCFYFQSGFGG